MVSRTLCSTVIEPDMFEPMFEPSCSKLYVRLIFEPECLNLCSNLIFETYVRTLHSNLVRNVQTYVRTLHSNLMCVINEMTYNRSNEHKLDMYLPGHSLSTGL